MEVDIRLKCVNTYLSNCDVVKRDRTVVVSFITYILFKRIIVEFQKYISFTLSDPLSSIVESFLKRMIFFGMFSFKVCTKKFQAYQVLQFFAFKSRFCQNFRWFVSFGSVNELRYVCFCGDKFFVLYSWKNVFRSSVWLRYTSMCYIVLQRTFLYCALRIISSIKSY